MKQQATVLVGIALVLAACGGKVGRDGGAGRPSTGDEEIGGSSASGGAGGLGGGATSTAGFCSNGRACGGSLVGTWSVASSCLDASGMLDVYPLGLECSGVVFAGSYQVSGVWAANANGTYVDKTTTTGDERIQVPPECRRISGLVISCDSLGLVLIAGRGYASTACREVAGGGCTCDAKVQQFGGSGQLSIDPPISGAYAITGSAISLDSQSSYPYCVAADTMTWTRGPDAFVTSGTIVFQR
jgi:hypothetical protein